MDLSSTLSSAPPALRPMFDYVVENRAKWRDNLAEAVAIRSVSAWKETRGEVDKMVDWVAQRLEKLGAKIELVEVGHQTFPDGTKLKLPRVLLGQLGNDKSKKTLLIYGHLDVQPADISDGWNTEPFVLTDSADGSKMYGRGSTDDKGPVLCWLHAIESYRSVEELPINLKFCLEGMEESGSLGLDELLRSRQNTDFLIDVDYICISDNYWLSKDKPCITYGLRGNCYFFVEVECSNQDLHSGVFGGTVFEAMSDLIFMLNTLIDKNGKILIKELEDHLAPVTKEEMTMYENINFDVEDYKQDIGASKLIYEGDKIKTLMARWRYNSLSIHGIQGAFSEPGEKTVIPRKVIGKFSVRIVPNQTPEIVEKIVLKYLQDRWSERQSPNKFRCHMSKGGKCWVSNTQHENYVAGINATKVVYGTEPDMTREGCSIPITLSLEEVTGKNVMLLPIGACDDGAHSQNEKINTANYLRGTMLLIAYIHELGKLN